MNLMGEVQDCMQYAPPSDVCRYDNDTAIRGGNSVLGTHPIWVLQQPHALPLSLILFVFSSELCTHRRKVNGSISCSYQPIGRIDFQKYRTSSTDHQFTCIAFRFCSLLRSREPHHLGQQVRRSYSEWMQAELDCVGVGGILRIAGSVG